MTEMEKGMPTIQEKVCSIFLDRSVTSKSSAAVTQTRNEMFREANRLYCILLGRVSQGETSWLTLTEEEDPMLKDTIYLWMKSATLGVDEAYFNLGIMIWNGWGIKQDGNRALGYFNEAARLDISYVDNNIAFICEHHKKDDFMALTWYLKAADNGLAKAQQNFATMCREGRASVAVFNSIKTYPNQKETQLIARITKELGNSKPPVKTVFCDRILLVVSDPACTAL